MRDHERDIEREEPALGSAGVSRRDFLRGSSALAAATALGSSRLAETEAQAA